MPEKNELVVVDTNCLVRLYFSPVRPLLARPVANHSLKTLDEMAEELRRLAAGERHAWLSEPVILDEVNGAVIKLTRAQRRSIAAAAVDMRKTGDNILRAYCKKHKLRMLRNLSGVDAFALAAALELKAKLATDEWPLRMVAAQTDADDSVGRVPLLSSVELLSFVEREGLCTREQSRTTYRNWANYQELTRDAPMLFKKLFEEEPPAG